MSENNNKNNKKTKTSSSNQNSDPHKIEQSSTGYGYEPVETNLNNTTLDGREETK